MWDRLKRFLRSNRRALALVPFLLGTLWFFLLEEWIPIADNYIEAEMDGHIPFIPWFVVPYVIWYFYIAAVLLALYFRAPGEFVHMALFLGLGMLISCCVFALYPNGQMLRPNNPGIGLFGQMIRNIYRADTNTNSLPSIHVIYALGTHIALARQTGWKKRWLALRIASSILCALICASTVFIKQHSILDVFAGVGVSLVLYLIVYRSGLLRQIYRRLGVHRVHRLAMPAKSAERAAA